LDSTGQFKKETNQGGEYSTQRDEMQQKRDGKGEEQYAGGEKQKGLNSLGKSGKKQSGKGRGRRFSAFFPFSKQLLFKKQKKKEECDPSLKKKEVPPGNGRGELIGSKADEKGGACIVGAKKQAPGFFFRKRLFLIQLSNEGSPHRKSASESQKIGKNHHFLILTWIVL